MGEDSDRMRQAVARLSADHPHRQWRKLASDLGATEDDVARALVTWRDEQRRAGSGKGYFDALM